MKNPTTKIEIGGMPGRLRAGFTALISKGEDPSLADGNIVSEVGKPTLFNLSCYDKSFLAYKLRNKRKVKLPDHLFGHMRMNQAFSMFIPRVVAVPPIQTGITMQPRISPYQAQIMQLYRYVQADAIWIVHIPSPIGTGVLLEASCPEIDTNTKTRGVRWRPQAVNTIAFYTPWSNDLSVVPVDAGRVGQSGLALTIRTIEDNTTNTVNTPLNITVYCCVFNVRMSGLIPNDNLISAATGLNFTPVATTLDSDNLLIQDFDTSEEILVPHSDSEQPSNEVQAEGVGNLPEQIAEDSTPQLDLAVPTEKPISTPAQPAGSRRVKDQQGAVGSRWFELQAITLNTTVLGEWQNLTIDPRQLDARGENISLAYRRNLWVTGSDHAGYVRTLKIKLVISRPPQISGLVEVQDSRNISSRYLVEFGSNVEIDLIPRNFSSATLATRPRYYNNKYLRTNEAQCDFRYKLIGINRTADVADVTVRILVRAGSAIFDTPTKPQPTNSLLATQWLVEDIQALVDQKDEEYRRKVNNGEVLTYHSNTDEGEDAIEVPVEDPEDAPSDAVGENNFESQDYVAPSAGEGYSGEINIGGAYDEDIEQDDFAVEIWRGQLPVGSVVNIPLNLAIISDESGTTGISTIAQKFERNAHVIPSAEGKGDLGPRIGTYTIETRLPATIAGQISHLALPGDLVDEAAVFAFGLGDILSVATSALQAVGGPMLSGAIGAGRMIWDLVKGIGGKHPDEASTTETDKTALTGPIDISRFLNFLKPIAQNEILDPSFGQLLINARDFIGSDGAALSSIPARVWARMDKSSIERGVFDRFITPSTTMVNENYIPYDRWPYITERFLQHPKTFVAGTHQNQSFMKFVTVLRTKGASASSITINEVLNYQLTEQDKQAFDGVMQNHVFIPV